MKKRVTNGLSIIIPTYNRASLLEGALASVQQLRCPLDWKVEVIVVDNNSTDSTAEVVANASKAGPYDVRAVIEVRQGLNYGRNRGIEEAQFEHLIFLDDDMLVDAGWLEGYVEAIETLDPDCVVGPVEPWFERPPDSWLTDRMLESVSSTYSLKGDELVLVEESRAHEVPGCNFGVRTMAAREVGGFHPRLDRSGKGMLAGGDTELGEKLVFAGKKTAYSPKCRIQHFISQSKVSRAGLRARWEGLGATSRVLGQLRGDDPSIFRRLRLFGRMLRYFIRSIQFRLVGQRDSAFDWELHALRLRGFLFSAPRDFEQRGDEPFTKPD